MLTDNTLLSLYNSKPLYGDPKSCLKKDNLKICKANISGECLGKNDKKYFRQNVCIECCHAKQIIENRKRNGKPSIILNKNYTQQQAFDFLNMLKSYQILKLSGSFTEEQELKLNEIFKPENIKLYKKEIKNNGGTNSVNKEEYYDNLSENSEEENEEKINESKNECKKPQQNNNFIKPRVLNLIQSK
jgi:hypothetical protein